MIVCFNRSEYYLSRDSDIIHFDFSLTQRKEQEMSALHDRF